ncbi:hypothetical protein [Halomicrobium salinisoli]|uniref:hypothetical protein n=1 Tax=Halomicrobium salinisoli TaxID=2878391 RepID=UPI001CEFFB92|nr:hypothetical protein [Halomicrobium salinisoli]
MVPIDMNGVLNTGTNTVHRHRDREARARTACGATRHVADERLDRIDVDRALSAREASKCGRCFSDGGGY